MMQKWEIESTEGRRHKMMPQMKVKTEGKGKEGGRWLVQEYLGKVMVEDVQSI